MTSPTSSRFNKLFQRGTEHLQRGDHDRAIRLLSKAYEIDAQHYDVALNLSSAYILDKKFKLALPILERLKETHSNTAQVWINLGAAYLGNPILARDEEQQKAISAFKRALDIDPVAYSVAYNLGLVYRDRQETETAKHWFQQALKHNPNDRSARYLLNKLETAKEDEHPL